MNNTFGEHCEPVTEEAFQQFALESSVQCSCALVCDDTNDDAIYGLIQKFNDPFQHMLRP